MSTCKNVSGSVLVLVLWILMLVSFMTAEHVARNREGVGLTIEAVNDLERQQAVASIIRLFAVDDWPLPQVAGGDGRWIDLELNDQKVWVRRDIESSRPNLNTADETAIRDEIRRALGDDYAEDADSVCDSILDWLDKDDLVRLEGAEAAYYEDLELGYGPANGPFKTLTELLLVKDVTPQLFLGDVLGQITRQQAESLEDIDMEFDDSFLLKGLIDIFTLFGEGVRRITILIPVSASVYYLNYIFIARDQTVLQRYTTFYEEGVRSKE